MQINLQNFSKPILLLFCIISLCQNDDRTEFINYSIDSTLVSGEPIRVGTNDGVGDFALNSIQSSPIGAVNIYGGDRPDIFVVTDRWNPGLYLYKWIGDNDSGLPIFSQPIPIDPPFEGANIEPGHVFEDENDNIFGIWLREKILVVASFCKQSKRFHIVDEIEINGLPMEPYRVTSQFSDDGRIVVYLGVPDGSGFRAPGDHRGEDYRPYDGSGIWTGPTQRDGVFRFSISWPNFPNAIEAEEVLPMEHGGLFGIFSMGIIYPKGVPDGQLLYGTKLGGVFMLDGATADVFDKKIKKKYVLSDKGVAIRHPAVWMNLLVYPSLDGDVVDLVAGGEGGMFYYEYQGLVSTTLQPIYKEPREVQQESAQLYKGSLIVPNVVDWNGNGDLDIIAGNAAGDIIFFENHGTNKAPKFVAGVHLESGGEPILIKGGYRGTIQGPPEAHWGYTSPTVIDWNQNGLLDIVMNDARGMHTVYLNVGTKSEPKLGLPKSLYLESLNLAGTWRTRPAAGLIEDRMAYITLDTDDDIHLYWQHDKYNLEDGGKLLMKRGSTINANFLKAGGKGRAKFELVDWDGDGKIDLLIGTPRHAAFPEPEQGVPWSMNRAGAAVLLLRNVGTNYQPVYEEPAIMHYKGKPMHFGQHSCSPTVTTLGGGGLNILVGTEIGEMIFFRGDDISFIQQK